MREYDETTLKVAERVLKRSNEIVEKRKKRSAMIKKISFSVSGMCAAIITVVGIWHFSSSIPKPSNDPNPPDIITATETSTETNTTSTTSKNTISPNKSTESSYITSVSKETTTSSVTIVVSNDNTTETASLVENSQITDTDISTTIAVNTEKVTESTKNNINTSTKMNPPTDITTETSVSNQLLPIIKLYRSAKIGESQYTEMKKDEIVKIETDYNPIMSDMSGIGILLEFDSKDYPITLSTNEGHFTTWDKETGVGVVSNVGKTYDIGNKGYVFWTPDSLNFDEDFESEIIMVGDNNGKNIELGKLVVNMNDKHSLTAVLK